jgi:hypothetical protein
MNDVSAGTIQAVGIDPLQINPQIASEGDRDLEFARFAVFVRNHQVVRYCAQAMSVI